MPDNWLTSAARFLRPSAAPARAAAEPPAGCALTPSNRYVDGEDAASYRERLIRDIEGEGADCATAHQLIDRRISNLADPAQREHAPHHIVRYLTTYAVTPKGPGVLVDIGASEIYGAPLETLKGWDIRAVPVLSFDYEVDRLPFADESADGVLICEVIEHFAMDPLFCFIEINRILKPNGFVVFSRRIQAAPSHSRPRVSRLGGRAAARCRGLRRNHDVHARLRHAAALQAHPGRQHRPSRRDHLQPRLQGRPAQEACPAAALPRGCRFQAGRPLARRSVALEAGSLD